MLTLTDRAVSVLKELCAAEAAGLRISANSSGCSGVQYGMALEEEPQGGDEILTFDDMQVYVDPSSSMWLTGLVVDYVEGEEGPGFSFDNPTSTAKCSCSGKCG